MAWIRAVSGKLEGRYRYSNEIVYNNFPWAENPTEKQIKAVEEAAQNVLDVRAKFPESSLADLYDPNTMPPELVKAHQALDKAVDLCYRSQPFINETKRIEFLFELYDKYTSGLFVKEKKKKK
ncbi:MAG: DNA methylase [Chitinophagaceae bacterium]|nr:DNA methylase [Chitinophagaceae bacterium]